VVFKFVVGTFLAQKSIHLSGRFLADRAYPRNNASVTIGPRARGRVAPPGAHAVIPLDQAGWHLSGKLRIPSNITLISLLAKCLELNPQENVWQFMRHNWLSIRIFKSYAAIVDHCCAACNKLIDQPWKIMPIAMHDSVYGDQRVLL
jgi:hypothetical protein